MPGLATAVVSRELGICAWTVLAEPQSRDPTLFPLCDCVDEIGSAMDGTMETGKGEHDSLASYRMA
jgi:hypothetical protein